MLGFRSQKEVFLEIVPRLLNCSNRKSDMQKQSCVCAGGWGMRELSSDGFYFLWESVPFGESKEDEGGAPCLRKEENI